MENKKSEMSVEYNMDEMKKSLKNLKETECYDVKKSIPILYCIKQDN